MIAISRIQPAQIEEVKRLIYTVAHPLFLPQLTLEEAIRRWEEHQELHDVDGVEEHYFRNGGTFFVMVDGERMIGTGAIRRLEDDVCELKRLWFLPEYHGKGLGYRMMRRLIADAREKGYRTMRLQTDATHQSRAIAFYHRLGFTEIPHYRPAEDTLSMEIDITAFDGS